MRPKENVFDTLMERGYFEQVTHEELRDVLGKECVPFYIGFDPTADSLHIGHFISLMVASHMQRAGHKPIILIGGGTATIGDPSGKTDMRRMMTREEINHNVECFKKQMSKFLNFEGENGATIVNNADWLLDLKFVEFMRDIGSLFSVNKMLAAECYKQRMERGLTFFELGYMLMQSYDFLHLYETYGCKLEMGGNDQWSNILGGVDLIRRVGHSDSYGFTFKLLTTKEGKKMGKTEKGAVWLDPEKTSPYDFFQYWRNVDDNDVIKCLKMLTFVPIEEIENMERTMKGAELNKAKEILAYELTKLVHGSEEADKCIKAARDVFSGAGNSENMPTTSINADELENNEIGILTLLVKTGLASSNGEGRRLVQQGGISVNDTKIIDPTVKIDLSNEIIIRKGKKVFHKAVKA